MIPQSSRPPFEKNPVRMPKRPLFTIVLLVVSPAGRLAMAQPPKGITLSEAEQIALRRHPRISSASLVAQAAKAIVTEVRAPLYPMLSGNLTSVGTEHNAALAAGAVQTSSLSSRVAAGLTISQLIT